MRKGLYPIIAGSLILLWLLAEIFETEINTASPHVQALMLGITGLVAISAILLALWDTKIIGKQKK